MIKIPGLIMRIPSLIHITYKLIQKYNRLECGLLIDQEKFITFYFLTPLAIG